MNKEKLRDILDNDKKGFEVKRDNSIKVVDKHFIKNLREKLDYTQVVFASVLGVSVKTIEKWEQGAIEPRPMIKKFLYLIDLHPGILNDIYSYNSHDKTKNTVIYKVNAENSFFNSFKENTFLKDLDSVLLFPNEREYKISVASYNKLDNNCCPAS